MTQSGTILCVSRSDQKQTIKINDFYLFETVFDIGECIQKYTTEYGLFGPLFTCWSCDTGCQVDEFNDN